MFEKFSHEITGPYLWLIILVLSLRAIYSSAKKKDYVHLLAFIFVAAVAAFMAALALGLLPEEIAKAFA